MDAFKYSAWYPGRVTYIDNRRDSHQLEVSFEYKKKPLKPLRIEYNESTRHLVAVRGTHEKEYGIVDDA